MPNAGLFNRLKTWIFEEVLKSSDLNKEFDNIINHLSIPYLSGDTNLAQMQTQKDPGGLGTENIPTNLQDELNEIKFTIARISGQTYFYQSPSLTLSDINTLLKLGVGIPTNRIVSGKTVSTSKLADFLLADGTSSKVTLKAGSTDFIVVINNIQYTISADIPFMGMSLAPSSNNTAVMNSNYGVGSESTGETDDLINTVIDLTSVGSNISALVGQYVAFKVQSSGEYFIGYLESSTRLVNCFRGYFFDETDSPKTRQQFVIADVLQLMKLTWVFVTSTSTIDVTYTTPVISTLQPSSPSPGDYWFDLANQTWKKFSGSSFDIANAMLIGTCIQDTTKTVGARSFDFFAVFNALNTFEFDIFGTNTLVTATTVSATSSQNRISVYGFQYDYGLEAVAWSSTTDLETGVTIGINSLYYLYITETGALKISDQKPYDRSRDLLGKYHPYNSWRAISIIQTDGSGNFTTVDSPTYTAPAIIDYIKGQQMAYQSIDFNRLRPRQNNNGLVGSSNASSSSGSFSSSSTSFVNVTNLSVNCSSTGGPVLIIIGSDFSGNSFVIFTSGGGGAVIRVVRNGSFVVGTCAIEDSGVPMTMLDLTSDVGTNTYQVQVKAGAGTVNVDNAIIFAIQL